MGEAVETAVARLLSAMPCSTESFSPSKLREWVHDYLRDRDDDVAAFPQTAGDPHWNLWMLDAEQQRAPFVLVVFQRDTVNLICGIASSFALQKFHIVEPQLVSEWMTLLRETAIELGAMTSFSRSAFEEWIGRRW